MELDEQNNLNVTNKETGEEIPATQVNPRSPDAPKKWSIEDGDKQPFSWDTATDLTKADIEGWKNTGCGHYFSPDGMKSPGAYG